MCKSIRHKIIDKTEEEWEDIVELWHLGEDTGKSLQEFMGLDDNEYETYLHGKVYTMIKNNAI